MTTQEAVLSSKIEGTQASLTDVLEYDAGLSKNNEIDIKEVLNYRSAMFLAMDTLKKRPLNLNAISKKNNWHKWIEFFLNAIIEQSKINTQKVEDILILNKEVKKKMHNAVNTKYSLNVVDAIFTSPIFSSRNFTAVSKIPTPSNMILTDAKILKLIEPRKGNKPSIYQFDKLLEITER
jgi:Fic family protein